jgi:hypothetical protein
MRKKIFANKFLVVCLVISGLFGVSLSVDAYFSDEEKSENYGFSLGTLDAGASFSEGGGFSSIDPSEENELSRKIEIKNQGSLDFQYRIEVRNESGEYCSELELEADNLSNSGVECESSGLEGFECEAQNVLAAEKSETWELRLAKSGKDLNEAQECQFDLAVVAWQENMPNEEKGFWDEEILSEEVTFAETESSTGNGDVVINEVMWMGSSESTSDEWIELKNMTDETIDLSGFVVENLAESNGDITIPDGENISAKKTYLISNYDKNDPNSSLNVESDLIDASISLANNDNGNLVLRNNDNEILDEIEGNDWPAGANDDINRSMQRKLEPGNGTLEKNWCTAYDSSLNDTDYWDVEGDNYGSPGAENICNPIVLNEFLPNSSEETYEYIELYNNGDSEVDAEGYYIELQSSEGDIKVIDINSSTTKEYENESTIVPDGGFLAVTTDVYEDLDEHNDILDNAEGSLRLYDNHDRLLDAVEYPLEGEDSEEVREDKTIARIPDGTGDWVDPVATPGESNVLESEESEESGKSRESGESGKSKGSEEGGESESESGEESFIKKEVEIKFLGEPGLKDGLELETKKKIENAELKVSEDFEGEAKVEVDLSKLEFEKTGGFEFSAEELFTEELLGSEEIKLISPEKEDIVWQAEVFGAVEEVGIEVSGELRLSEDLEKDNRDLKIEEVEVSGWEGSEEILEIDLEELDKVKKTGKIEVRIEDLDLEGEAEIVSHDQDEVVLEIEVREKDEKDKEKENSEKKKEEAKNEDEDEDEDEDNKEEIE